MNKMTKDLLLRVDEYKLLLEHAEMMQMDEGTLYSLREDIKEWEALAGTYEKGVDCFCDGKNKRCNLCAGIGVISSNVQNL